MSLPPFCVDCGGARRKRSARCGPCYRAFRLTYQREYARAYRADSLYRLTHREYMRRWRTARASRSA